MSEDESALRRPSEGYQRYVAEQAGALDRADARSSSTPSRPATSRRQGALPGGAHLLGADRAGRRDLRRPRPADRRPGGRPGRPGDGVHRLAPASRRTLWVDGDLTDLGRSPTSSWPTCGARRAAATRSSLDPLQLANGAKELSTRSPPARSPARRTATRTPTWDFKANLEGSRPRCRRCARSSTKPTRTLVAVLDERFAGSRPSSEQYRVGGRLACSRPSSPGAAQGPQRQHHGADRVGQPGRGGGRGPLTRVNEQERAPAGLAAGGCSAGRAPSPRGAGRGRHRRGDRPVHPLRDGVVAAPRPTRRRSPGAPGRDRHPGAGPAALRRLRRHDRRPRRARRAAAGLDRRRPPDDRGPGRRPDGAVDGNPYAPPDDTGEALGLPAVRAHAHHRLRADALHDADGADRFGLAARRPAPLTELPPFAGDQLDPAICGGDLCIQACANDPQVAVHAVRNLVRLGAGVVERALVAARVRPDVVHQHRAADPAQPVRLQGRHQQPQGRERRGAATASSGCGDGDSGADWLAGGSYLVTRRIRMLIEPWDRSTLDEQERTIGRTKGAGAPLGQRREFDPVDFTAQPDGEFAIPETSHVFLANPTNSATALLRRGYSFVDGSDGLGPARRGPVLHRLPARPGDRLRPGPAEPAARTP